MFSDNPDTKWSREFNELGSGRVRELMLSPSWDREKKGAARRWLEKQDVKAWQAAQATGQAQERSLKHWLRDTRKWWLLAIGVGFALAGLVRFIRF